MKMKVPNLSLRGQLCISSGNQICRAEACIFGPSLKCAHWPWQSASPVPCCPLPVAHCLLPRRLRRKRSVVEAYPSTALVGGPPPLGRGGLSEACCLLPCAGGMWRSMTAATGRYGWERRTAESRPYGVIPSAARNPSLRCLLPVARCLLPVACCPLPVARCLLPVSRCPLPVALSGRDMGRAMLAPTGWCGRGMRTAESRPYIP